MKIIDNAGKLLTRRNRNFFFAGTVAIIVINILLFAILGDGDNWCYTFYNPNVEWEGFVPLNLLAALTSSFGHVSWEHVLMNMFAFLAIGLYLERRTGTIKLLALILLFAFFSAGLLAVVNNRADEGVGYSGVNYALIGYLLLDYFISLPKEIKNKNKFQLIFGAIVVVGLTAGTFVNSDAPGIVFAPYPYNLVHNVAHYSGLFAGLLVGIYAAICPKLEHD
jgi:rhomboid protease GluP